MKRLLPFFSHYLLLTLGAALTAVSVSVFCLPNKIVGGGASGISIILYHLFSFEPGVTTAVINVVLLIAAAFILGKQFVGKTIYGACALSFFIQLFTHIPAVTDDLFISAVAGAVCEGVGMGIMLADGGSSGGTDIIGRLVQSCFKHMHIGTLMIIADAIIILSTLFYFKDIELVFYGLFLLFLSGSTINYLMKKLNVSKLAFIITENGAEAGGAIMNSIERGVTVVDARGAYTNSSKQVLMCALKDSEMPRLKSEVARVDSGAFVIFTEAQQIIGNGFYFYS